MPSPFLFQIRGVTNAIKKVCSSCGEGEKPVVVTHSSGNHAQAVALAAQWCGIPAHIVMPSNSSPVKVQAVEGYGGIITFCEPTEQVERLLRYKYVCESKLSEIHTSY